jgi:hypothetical protein
MESSGDHDRAHEHARSDHAEDAEDAGAAPTG